MAEKKRVNERGPNHWLNIYTCFSHVLYMARSPKHGLPMRLGFWTQLG